MQCDGAIAGTSALADLLPTLATGDLVLFSGRGWASDIIRWFCASPWTHVGMVIRLEEVPAPLIIEALVSAEARDWTTGTRRAGVVMTFAGERMQGYGGGVAIRRLQRPLAAGLCDALNAQARQWCHLPYRQYLSAQARKWLLRREQGHGMFCSELVAGLYRVAGRLPPQCSPASALPGHFAADDGLSLALALGRLHIVKPPVPSSRAGKTAVSKCCDLRPDSTVVSADQLRYV